MIYLKNSLSVIIILITVLCFMSCNNNSLRKAENSNELINETSPYLLQHAYNPVNWKAWNDKTLEIAKRENKLMIISIGYSACHWCHVMEEESFENDSIANIMNENFINIKVDREERPDVDKVYVNAVELMTGNAGWPLNCITLPDGRPIFGGTYFTKNQWKKILLNISKLYKETPEKAIEYAEKLTEGLQSTNLITLNKKESSFDEEEVVSAIDKSKELLDKNYGGFKGSPKFPMPTTLDYLLRYQHQFDDKEIASYLNNTLTKMAYGGINDQLAGGFSRYSVDEKWHVPHFEKMLYDNAQLVSVYSMAYAQSKNKLYKKVVEETLEFISNDLTDNDTGAFYSSLDADSENENGESEEGAYYVWTIEKLKEVIKEDFNLFKEYFNLNEFGLWEEGKYVFIRNQSDSDFAQKNGLSIDELEKKIFKWKSDLLSIRNQRKKPNLDDKVLTSWNALMLQGYVDAYKAFGNEEYKEIAIKNARFLLNNQLRNDGGLNRNYKEGKSTINAYLEDYANVISGFLSLYEITFDESYLSVSKKLMDYTLKHFYDEKSGMFFYTSNESKSLITREIEIFDGVIPSSNSMIANNLFKLSHHFSDTKFKKIAEQMIRNLKSDIETYPLNFANWLQLATSFSNNFYEVAIVGKNAETIGKELFGYYIPNILITGTTKESNLPLLQNKFIDNETYIYVCTNGTCKAPQKDLNKAMEMIKN